MSAPEAGVSSSDKALYFLGVVLSAAPVISLIQHQFGIPTAPAVEQALRLYRALSDAVGRVLHMPLVSLKLLPPQSLTDLQILSFTGMGMMTRGMQQPGEKPDWMGALVWNAAAFVMAWFLVGLAVIGALLVRLAASPRLVFMTDHELETTPALGGLQGRLRREREMRLERDLARIALISLALVPGYFALNSMLLNRA